MRNALRHVMLSAAMATAGEAFMLLGPEAAQDNYAAAYRKAAAGQNPIYLIVGGCEPELAAFLRRHCHVSGHVLAVEDAPFTAGGRVFSAGVYRFEPPRPEESRIISGNAALLPMPLIDRRQMWSGCVNGQCGVRR